MLMVLAFAACVALVPVLGGSLRALSHLKLRWSAAAAGALIAQVVVISLIPGGHPALHDALHVASYVPVLGFLVVNRKIRGMPVVALGTLANVVAIGANGGIMPASAGALERAGLHVGHGFSNSAPITHAHLAWLGDIFATPSRVPFHNVFSPGDVLIIVGAVLVVFHASGIGRRASSKGSFTQPDVTWRASTDHHRPNACTPKRAVPQAVPSPTNWTGPSLGPPSPRRPNGVHRLRG